ncbi:MAG: carboxyl transferase [Firmicutes bacterium]|nr:carboxyl transferase [Bacillota bacterium]
MTNNTSAFRRLELILDAGSFMELGEGVTARSTDFGATGKALSDGVVTGYGSIDGRPVYVYSQDASVMGGTLGEMHAKKILRMYKLAMKTGTPVLALIDTNGLRLEEGADALHAYGKLFKAQADARGIVPQIAAVFGSCGGGMAVAAGMADFVLTEEGKGNIFINAPAARAYTGKRNEIDKFLKAAPSNDVAAQTGDEESLCAYIRTLYGYLPLSFEDCAPVVESEDDLNRLVSCSDPADPEDVLMQIADAGSYLEVGAAKKGAALTGFMRLDGMTVGFVANKEEKLTAAACEKMAEFVDFCGAFDLPLLTVTNAAGFSNAAGEEEALPKAAAYLAGAFACAEVPSVNLITGKAMGSAFSVMNNKALGAEFVFAWKDAKVQVMPEDAAVKILFEEDLAKSPDKPAFIAGKGQEYLTKAGLEGFLARGYVDRAIEPEDSRKTVLGAFEMLLAQEY